MAGNYVEILVRDRDEAKPDLDALRDRLRELNATVARARAEVDDAGAAARLDRIQAKLLDLDHKTSNPKIRVAGAIRAEAEIHAVEASLDNLSRKEDQSLAKAGPGGLLDRLMNGLSGAGSQKMGVPLLGQVPLPALPAIVAGFAALLTEVTGVVSGFAAAGAGAAAFGVLALPAVKHVEAAYQALNAAHQKYQQAQDKYNLDPTKGNAAALKSAKDNLMLAGQAIGKLPGDEQKAIDGLYQLTSAFGKISRAFEPKAFPVFADVLKIANNLLPQITPFANTFADVLDKLLKQAGQFTQSKGFTDWLKQFHGLEGPALHSIGEGIGQVANAIGKLLTSMSSKDVAHSLNIAFDGVAGAIKLVTMAVKGSMTVWDGVTSEMNTVAHNFDNIRRAAAIAGHDIAHAFDNVRHDIASKFDGVRQAIASKFDGAASWLANVPHNIASAFDNVRHDIAAKFDGARSEIAAKFAGAIGWLVSAGEAIMHGLLNGLTAGWSSVAGWLSSLGGKIKSLKGPLDYDLQLLKPEGQAIMDGLMNGMASRMPDLRRQLGQVGRMISGMDWAGPNPYGRLTGWGPGGPAAPVVVQLEVTSGGGGSAFDQLVVQAIRNNVRVRGGNVQNALGH